MNDQQHSQGPADDHEPVRVVIVDDHPSYAQGLATLLSALGRIEVVGLAHSARAALEQTALHRPDVVVMDMRLPERSGIEVTEKIRAELPDVKVVILSGSAEREDVQGAMSAGASGYLLKQSNAGDLVTAIKAVHAGQTVIEPSLVATLLTSDPQRPALDDQDIYVLRLLARGWELSRVAKEISVSESTLKRQVAQIQEKLGASNRIQAVVAAATRGLL